MAEPVLKAGASVALTGIQKSEGDADTASVTLEGSYAALAALTDAQREAFVPDGYRLEGAALATAGDGMGRLTLSCSSSLEAEEGAGVPTRETFRITMEEVDYDLVDHPGIHAAARALCLAWLAADPAERFRNGAYFAPGADGAYAEISDQEAQRFCAAWSAGIRTFRRFYPVVELRSWYRNPPGMAAEGRSFRRGTPEFSRNIGTFDDPPVSLRGYGSGFWFKSGDAWEQQGARSWLRTQTWTYTPEGSRGDHAWIYGGGE